MQFKNMPRFAGDRAWSGPVRNLLPHEARRCRHKVSCADQAGFPRTNPQGIIFRTPAFQVDLLLQFQ